MYLRETQPDWCVSGGMSVEGAVGAVGFPIVYERVLPLLTALLGALALAWSIGREHDIWMIGILAFLGMAVQIIIAGRR